MNSGAAAVMTKVLIRDLFHETGDLSEWVQEHILL